MHEIDSKHVSIQWVAWTARQVYRSTLMSAMAQERHNLRPSENCILKSNSMDFGTLHKWESAGGTELTDLGSVSGWSRTRLRIISCSELKLSRVVLFRRGCGDPLGPTIPPLMLKGAGATRDLWGMWFISSVGAGVHPTTPDPPMEVNLQFCGTELPLERPTSAPLYLAAFLVQIPCLLKRVKRSRLYCLVNKA